MPRGFTFHFHRERLFDRAHAVSLGTKWWQLSELFVVFETELPDLPSSCIGAGGVQVPLGANMKMAWNLTLDTCHMSLQSCGLR